MHLTPLFWAVLAGSGALWYWLERRSRADDQTTDSNPSAPGYRKLGPEQVIPDKILERHGPPDLELNSVEALNSADRNRLYIRAQLDPEDETQKLLPVSESLVAHLEANVVAWEFERRDQKQSAYFLYAPDGRGWAGQEPIKTLEA